MRVVKFRAWDKEIEKIYPVLKIDFVEEWVSMYSKITGRHYNWLNNLVLMQYVGLQDKNGEEIYEGDVVSFKSAHSDCDYKTIGEVVWYCGEAAFLVECNGEIFKHFDEIREIEVLGNIYENPELLQ